MCDICKELVACPVGEKRRVTLKSDPLPPRDPYGHKLIDDGKVFFIDKWPDGHTNCGIYSHYHDENNVCHGGSVGDIRFCPFCGEQLVKEEKDV